MRFVGQINVNIATSVIFWATWNCLSFIDYGCINVNLLQVEKIEESISDVKG